MNRKLEKKKSRKMIEHKDLCDSLHVISIHLISMACP